MSGYLGDFTTANTVYILFNTFDSNDPSASVTITGLALGDILIYKDGSVTQRSSTAGFTLLDTDGIDFDGQTGIHGISIDLSDNTDAGFYAAGSEYTVVIASITVDAATVNFVAGSFSIERTGGVLALIKAARGEPGQGAPSVNPDVFTKVDYLYKSWRNKKDNDGSTTQLYADDTTTVDQKQTTTESGGTVTKGEWTTGP